MKKFAALCFASVFMLVVTTGCPQKTNTENKGKDTSSVSQSQKESAENKSSEAKATENKPEDNSAVDVTKKPIVKEPVTLTVEVKDPIDPATAAGGNPTTTEDTSAEINVESL